MRDREVADTPKRPSPYGRKQVDHVKVESYVQSIDVVDWDGAVGSLDRADIGSMQTRRLGKTIADLDGGVHAGWQRTGETFNAYGVGSSGRTGRRPVCRAYGNPAAGLDSHFYSASPQECVATLDNFGDDWLPEAAEVFQMELPDTATGACAADRVPIHRLWNGRADSSHRFVKTLALRAQMIARGFVPEGYGPDGVVFCALP